jgi:hypothetical protein
VFCHSPRDLPGHTTARPVYQVPGVRAHSPGQQHFQQPAAARPCRPFPKSIIRDP